MDTVSTCPLSQLHMCINTYIRSHTVTYARTVQNPFGPWLAARLRPHRQSDLTAGSDIRPPSFALH